MIAPLMVSCDLAIRNKMAAGSSCVWSFYKQQISAVMLRGDLSQCQTGVKGGGHTGEGGGYALYLNSLHLFISLIHVIRFIHFTVSFTYSFHTLFRIMHEYYSYLISDKHFPKFIFNLYVYIIY